MDKIYGMIRLGVAYAVGALATWLATGHDIVIDDELNSALISAITLVASVAWYLIVRIASKWLPWLEWFLGIPLAPVFVPPANRIAVKNMVEARGMDQRSTA